MFWIRTLAVALVAAVAVSAEDKKPADFDAKALLGKWTFSEGIKAGEKTEADKLKEPAEFTADWASSPASSGPSEGTNRLTAIKTDISTLSLLVVRDVFICGFLFVCNFVWRSIRGVMN